MTIMLQRHELVQHFVDRIAVWGKEMLFVEDDVLDVRVTSVDNKTMTLAATDIFGEVQAAVSVALHRFEHFTTDSDLHSFLAEDIYDGLVDSYFRDGKSVLLS